MLNRLADIVAKVATREGGVDRNITSLYNTKSPHNVATREGGVDRNSSSSLKSWIVTTVATREGGVDRNNMSGNLFAK